MGSSKSPDNVNIWHNVIRNKTTDEDILWITELAGKASAKISKDRNDYIHAVFHPITQILDGVSMVSYPHVARRVRNTALRPVSDLPSILDQAARLSCLVAHIDHLIAGNQATTSPWLQRLGPTLPPRFDTAEARKEKARRGQRKPSPMSPQKRRPARPKTRG